MGNPGKTPENRMFLRNSLEIHTGNDIIIKMIRPEIKCIFPDIHRVKR